MTRVPKSCRQTQWQIFWPILRDGQYMPMQSCCAKHCCNLLFVSYDWVVPIPNPYAWLITITITLPESKLIYFPAPELTSQVSGLSKLIAILIASPRFRTQKRTPRLNISVMVLSVLRNGWFSFSHTQFNSHHYSIHAVLSGYPCSLYSHITILYICYIHSIKLYTSAQILSHAPARSF